ncbi:S8 family serine peptidase [Arenibacter sp. GZD96]|uniref:S8 family serine peptidase n=1 Tax=Aurantibrevibacter litoralis TaxID=3106030 RepID=UPI002B001382|nr:S8 family serine peptidase [Arenibacter sp. GZD-96]MEA1787514.1 S8 family serine peptidase [Arenibacter sp. GZD-96]
MDYINVPREGFRANAFSLLFLLGCAFSFGQNEMQQQKIKEHYRASKLPAVTADLKKDFLVQRQQLLQTATAKGWKISEELPQGGYVELQDIGADGTPLYYTTFSDYATRVSRANTLYSNGLLNLDIDGTGMNVGIWDGGTALTTHQEFDSRVVLGDATGTTNAHATMVMGTLISKGIKAKAKGVAFNAKAVSHDWTRDKIEVAEAAANGLLVSNHSYGIQTDRVPDWYFGSYIKVTQEWDQIMYHAPYYLMVTASGNAQKMGHNSTPMFGAPANGFDLMLGFALTKNGITVAAADTKIDNNGRLTQANVAGYSSFGPADDGRIKPDLAGAGGSIYTTTAKDNSAYDTSFGTSMATPGITGTLLLLQQYYEQLYGTYMRAATVKGLALHTADDVGLPGPDYQLGWGVMNAMTAAQLITDKDYSTFIQEVTLLEGDTFDFTVKALENVSLLASISWTDPASDNVNTGILNESTPALVNDLDIRISKDGTTFYPWKLSAMNADQPATKGDNKVDPYEKIQIESAHGEYHIRISHKGKLKNGSQNFSLIVSGIAVTDCALVAPTGIQLVEADEHSVQFTWDAITDAVYEVHYSEASSDTWKSKLTSENKSILDGLSHQNEYKIRVRTICTENKVSEFSAVFEFSFTGATTVLELQESYETLTAPEKIGISIFPNPAMAYIVVQGKRSEMASYRILSMSGVLLQQGDVHDSGINVNHLSSGLYMLVIQDVEGLRTTKFYKS